MTHDPIGGTFEVTFALAESSGRLLVREAHACDHHKRLWICNKSASACRCTSGSILLGVGHEKGRLDHRVLYVLIKPHYGTIGTLVANIEDSMFGCKLWYPICN